MNRRGFIKNSGQMIIAGGLAAMTSYLIFREKPVEECKIEFACEQCHKAKTCQLPEAKQSLNHK